MKLPAFLLLLLGQLGFQVAWAELGPCNELLGGGKHRLLSQGLLENPEYASDGKKIVSVSVAWDSHSHSSLVIHDPKNRTEKYVDPFSAKAYPGVTVQTSSDGQFALFTPPAKYAASPVLYDVVADQNLHLKSLAHAKTASILSHSRYVVAKLPENVLGVYNIVSQKTATARIFEDGWDFVELGQSNRILLNSENGYMRIVDLETLTTEKVELPARVSDAQSSADGNTILFFNKFDQKQEQAFLYHSETKSFQTVPLKDPAQVQLLPDGNALLYVRKSQQDQLRLIEADREIVIDAQYGSGWSISADGRGLLLRHKDGSLAFYDRNSRQSSTVDLPAGTQVFEFSFLGQDATEAAIQFSHEGRFYFKLHSFTGGETQPYEIPFNASTVLSPDRKSLLFYVPDLSYFHGGSVVYYDLARLAAETVAGKISRSEVSKAYAALGEPGGFKMAEHSQLVLRFFESGEFKKQKHLSQKILLNVLSESIGLYESIIDRYPEFTPEGGFYRIEGTEDLAPRWKRAVIRYLDYFAVTRARAESIVESVKYLRPFQNALYSLNDTQLGYYADIVTEAMKDAAQIEYPGIFKSMLYKFCEQYIYPIFWIPYHTVTDLTYVRSAYRVEPVILGSEPISGDLSTRTPYGFYVRKLPTIEMDQSVKAGDVVIPGQKIRWTQGKDEYSVDLRISVKAESIDAVTPVLRRFSMSNYTQDGVLSGTIIIGANLHAEDKSTIDGYVAFFKKLGYKFQDSKNVSNLKAYFKERVINGEIDYFIKEAHSDGDEKNIFRINTRDKILIASRKVKGGKTQTIHIIIPSGKPVEDYTDPARTALITNEEMGEWIRLRKAAGHAPLIKFNTSCWSVSKMRNEIEASNSDGQIDIASTMPVSMFENDMNNAEFIMLNDFFAGRPFSVTRKKMRAYNAEYAHGIGNTFIYPDDVEYNLYIRSVLKPVLEIISQVKKNGRPYAIDE